MTVIESEAEKQTMERNETILVVMGGTSSEREVSLRSGEAMFDALIQKGYRAEKFILNEKNAAEIIRKNPRTVLLALHGKGGEDGCIQGMLDLAGIPYTGSGVASSAICMNKIFTKKILTCEGLRTADFLSVSLNEELDAEALAASVLKKIGLPAVVKAPCQGSSVGVKIARSKEELPALIREIYPIDHELLIEKYLPGKEITLPVYKKNGAIAVLPVIEIVSENCFYDYESKYTVGMSRHIIPARIPDNVKKELEEMGRAAYRALDCSGLIRVDFMLDRAEVPYIMEVNTLPGMTATSLVPDAANAAGISFPDLIADLIL